MFAALRDDHAFRAGLRHLDLRGDRVRLVLGVDDRVLRDPAHAGEEELRVAVHDHRAAGDVRVGALGLAVVEREHVVLGRFEVEEPLSSASFSGICLARSCACDQSFVVS